MRFGLKQKHIDAINSIFGQYPQIERVILYGSRAKGNYKIGSDIDLTLVGTHIDLTTQFKIENLLDDLLLPYTIDLSILSQIGNPDLIDHINRIGQVFYDKTKDTASNPKTAA
jgi:predicted nucleotidyltransferase